MSEESEITSRYPVLAMPEFRSAIPPHLTNQLSDAERHVVESLSRQEQMSDWLMRNMVANSRSQSELDVRLQRIEAWQTRFSVKWMLLSGGGLAALGAAVASLADRLIGK